MRRYNPLYVILIIGGAIVSSINNSNASIPDIKAPAIYSIPQHPPQETAGPNTESRIKRYRLKAGETLNLNLEDIYGKGDYSVISSLANFNPETSELEVKATEFYIGKNTITVITDKRLETLEIEVTK